MNSLTFSSFKIEPFNLLEGYISNFDETIIKPNNTEEEFQIIGSDEINQKYLDLSNNIGLYNTLNQNQKDLIDNSGNLLYKKNLNFKETIPSLKDAVLEDSTHIMNYNNNIYAISAIAIAILLVGVIVKSR